MRPIFFVAILVTCATGCTKVESKDLKTEGMSASLSVSADGTGKTTAGAQLYVDDSLVDHVDLSAGDTLTATSSGQTKTLQKTDILNIVSYSADFQGLDGDGAAYTIAFNRASDVSAPNSTCTLPAPFVITAPAPTATPSRASEDIVVTYSPSGKSDVMTWLATGDCVKSVGTQTITGDPGTFTIPKGTFQTASGGAAACNVTIQVFRTRNGQLDPAYGYKGRIFAEQARIVTFSTKP